MNGSSHEPATGAVAEKARTLESIGDGLAVVKIEVGTGLTRGRKGVAGDILRPWNARRSCDEALCFIVATCSS